MFFHKTYHGQDNPQTYSKPKRPIELSQNLIFDSLSCPLVQFIKSNCISQRPFCFKQNKLPSRSFQPPCLSQALRVLPATAETLKIRGESDAFETPSEVHPWSCEGCHSHRGTPNSWMVYFMENPNQKRMITTVGACVKKSS